ncbi:hypothetical protein M0R88_04965 [Halorussus gelatinilyticus]|uniref:Uncharacterized protein n=1 Tax=Halorussus gelatinilyticus TaxID=2937524 RepID=A0A8U0ILA2_9EURY|nr:hypothetical protein [Halorussus gelatinilyticus]UPW01456.1 hypothetical protein M0R88_04965 [Halorussus gelatinilyticus]
MKLNANLRRVAPSARTRHGRIAAGLTRFTLPVAALLAFVVSALATGAVFATAVDLVQLTLPVLLVGWVASIGATFALPVLVVRGVVALLERSQ